MSLFVQLIGITSHLDMSSTHNYNTRSKETSGSKIKDKITKHREELVENLKKSFTGIKDEIINLKRSNN